MALLRTLHAWTGAILSLILIVVGLSGGVLVFRKDIIRLATPEARETAMLTPQAIGAVLEAVERSHPGAARTFVASGPDFGLHQVYRTDGSSLLSQRGDEVASGAVEATEALLDLHKELLAGETGRLVVGLSGIAAVLLVLSGLGIWAPTWRTFRARLWPRSIRRGDLVSTHRNLGVLFAIPIVLFCATGAVIVFSGITGKVLARVLPAAVAAPKVSGAGVGDIDWPRALAAAQTRAPDGRLSLVFWPAWPGAPAVVRLAQPGDWRGADHAIVLIDPATSGVLFAADQESVSLGAGVQSAFDPLHAASIGGRPYDLLALVSSLALTGLGVLGLWSFLIKPRRRRERPVP